MGPSAQYEAVRQAIQLDRMRGLRMLGHWGQVQANLPGLVEGLVANAHPLQVRGLLLLAETQLCGPEQDLNASRNTLQALLALQLDASARSQTMGHLGLVALASHDLIEATEWLDLAIAEGEASARPMDSYRAIHWMSKKQMACLELDQAAASIRRLKEISERHGVAGDTAVHDRDLSRVMGLLGQVDEAASLCVRYVDSSGSPDGAVVSTLAFQVAELAELRGRIEAEALLRSFIDHAPGRMYDMSRRELATSTVRLLLQTEDIARTAADCSALGVGETHHANALAIFTFNVPDLAKLRRQRRA
jgi:hypothetical protein